MADKALILQAVKTYKHDKSFYFKAPQDLKPKQIPGAIKKWAKTVPEWDVVALMDTTLFDSGKEGFLVTEKEFIGHILYDVRIPLDNMVRCSHNDSYVTTYYRGRNEERFYASIFAEDMCNFFNRLISLTVEQKKKEEEARKKAEQEAAAQRKAQEELSRLLRESAAREAAAKKAAEEKAAREKAAAEKAAREKAAREKAAKEAAEKKATQEALARLLAQRKEAEAKAEAAAAKAAAERPTEPVDSVCDVVQTPNADYFPDDAAVSSRLSFLDAESDPFGQPGTSQPENFTFCPYCGTINPQGVRMCAACGTFLPEDQEADFHAASGGSLSDFLLEDFDDNKKW